MEQWGNQTTYNMEGVLRQNILQSDYFGRLHELGFYELVDEIYNVVEHVEPWMSGNARGASTAFCLLYRFFVMKLNHRQVQTLLDHGDSPYIRAVCRQRVTWRAHDRVAEVLLGLADRLLVSSLCGGPQTILAVVESASVRQGAPQMALRLVFLALQYYFETLFPRIPVLVERELKSRFEKKGLSIKALGNGGVGGGNSRAIDMNQQNRRPPSVKSALSVAMGQRAPHRTAAMESGRDAYGEARGHGVRDRDPRPSPPRRGDRPSPPRRDDRDRRDNDRARSRDRPRRDEWERSRRDDRDRGHRERGSARDRDRGRDRDRSRERHRGRSRERDRERDR
eukprot:scaffold1722_cov380-Prasinococcus_capsulatus_cf.AAC.13